MTRRLAAFAMLFAALVLGCARAPVERLEWTCMGTVAAVQTRGSGATADAAHLRVPVQRRFADLERLLSAHDPASELRRLAPRDERTVVSACDASVRACYETAFDLARGSHGVFNPRWRGPNTLDLGGIAKGYALDRAAKDIANASPESDVLLDLGGNLRCVAGEWSVGVRDPANASCAARVQLKPGEALATSAEYFRGKHIYDGRTGKPATNGVASVTVLARSALASDGLSTTLFVLGPDEGRAFLERSDAPRLVRDVIAVLWLMSDGRSTAHDPAKRFSGISLSSPKVQCNPVAVARGR